MEEKTSAATYRETCFTFFSRMVYGLSDMSHRIKDQIFEFDETENDWVKISQKMELIFLILNTFESISDNEAFHRYLKN